MTPDELTLCADIARRVQEVDPLGRRTIRSTSEEEVRRRLLTAGFVL